MNNNYVRVRRERFKQWLQSQKPTTVVGSTRNMNDTPIARYVSERSRIETRTKNYTRTKDGRSYQTSGWVTEFLDKLGSHSSENITARTALRLLD